MRPSRSTIRNTLCEMPPQTSIARPSPGQRRIQVRPADPWEWHLVPNCCCEKSSAQNAPEYSRVRKLEHTCRKAKELCVRAWPPDHADGRKIPIHRQTVLLWEPLAAPHPLSVAENLSPFSSVWQMGKAKKDFASRCSGLIRKAIYWTQWRG